MGFYTDIKERAIRNRPYEIIEYIACGGMAAVWLAYQHGARGFRRLVALKTVLPELSDPETEAELVEEARVIASIDHPNVCPIFELIEDAGLLALSMEWVDGDTLHGVLTGPHQEPLDCRIAAHSHYFRLWGSDCLAMSP